MTHQPYIVFVLHDINNDCNTIKVIDGSGRHCIATLESAHAGRITSISAVPSSEGRIHIVARHTDGDISIFHGALSVPREANLETMIVPGKLERCRRIIDQKIVKPCRWLCSSPRRRYWKSKIGVAALTIGTSVGIGACFGLWGGIIRGERLARSKGLISYSKRLLCKKFPITITHIIHTPQSQLLMQATIKHFVKYGVIGGALAGLLIVGGKLVADLAPYWNQH